MRYSYIAFCLLLSLLNLSPLAAQDLRQVVRGKVLEENGNQPVVGATVQIPDLGLGTMTDERGHFRLEGVSPGRHRLEVTSPGYEAFTLNDLLVSTGKEIVLELTVEEIVYPLLPIAIYDNSWREVNRVGTRTFTVEESKRFAAVYFDPARMATSFPGVAAANDQANHLVVRGNSPNGVSWRMEGVDIVNPNHLTNAGTFSDRVTNSGGGTIILSTQLLTNSTFSNGAFSPEYGNALSGIFDIHLREGNNEANEFTLQAGLIGVDVSAEGPISRKKGSSFLANYRYSTVGLITGLGVDFGGETISFQDFAFNLNLPTSRAGTFTVFGMGGLSFNRFKGQTTDSLREEAKERFDINFRSNMGAVGVTHRILLRDRILWETVVAASGISSEREGIFIEDSLTRTPVEEDRVQQVKLSARTGISYKLGKTSHLKVGTYLTQLRDSATSLFRPIEGGQDFQVLAANGGNTLLVQPYVNLRLNPFARLRLDIGLHSMYLALNGSTSLEPRVTASIPLSNRQNLRIGYGLHSQLQLPAVYYMNTSTSGIEPTLTNRDLDFTRAHHVSLDYNISLGKNLLLKLSPYYQYQFNAPVIQGDTTFSALNLIESFIDQPFAQQSLVNEGEGRNYGLEMSLERYLEKDYYFLLSGSLFESQYRSGGSEWLDTRFNTNYIFSATGGREWAFTTKKKKSKVWGVNLRGVYQGGFRAAPIDLAASEAAQRTIYDYSNGFSEQLPDYFRLDLRVTFRRDRAKYTRTFGFDIQNITNTRNVAFRVYDPVVGEVVDRLQLGLIPLISYRLEF